MTWKYKLNSYLVEPVSLEWTIEVWFDEYCVYPKNGHFKCELRKPVHQIWVFFKKLSINKQSAFASDWLSHFNIWWVESLFEQNPLRYVLKKRRGKMARQFFRNNCWLLNSSICRCKQSKEHRKNWSFVDVVQMGNSSKNLARYSLWMPGVHGRKILDSNLLGLIRSLCQGNVCTWESTRASNPWTGSMFSSLFGLWKDRVGQSRHWKVLNNTSETSKVLQLLWSFSKLFP